MGRISSLSKRKPASDLARFVGSQLLKARQANGFTMRDVSEKSGLSNAFICQLENGQSEPSASTIMALSKAFSVPVTYWFPDEQLYGWSKVPPEKSGLYWHWNGDADCCPVPIFVGFDCKTTFVQIGQLGITRAIDCSEYGGYWCRLDEPSPVSLAAQLGEDGK